MKDQKLNSLFFYSSLASIALAIALFQSSATLGVFVGLWAPTLMSLSNRYR
jgi:hypothetical protein